jgi:hypothetical protein
MVNTTCFSLKIEAIVLIVSTCSKHSRTGVVFFTSTSNIKDSFHGSNRVAELGRRKHITLYCSLPVRTSIWPAACVSNDPDAKYEEGGGRWISIEIPDGPGTERRFLVEPR